MPDELVAIGKVLRTVGLDGWCAVESFGKSFESIDLPVKVMVGLNQNVTRPVSIIEIQMRPKGIVCRFDGINDLQDAESIHDYLIFIDSKMLPPLQEQEFYHFELTGMAVISDDNRQIGIVKDVHNFPTTDSLEVQRKNGEIVLIPMNDDSIISIDKKQNRIVVNRSFLEELLNY